MVSSEKCGISPQHRKRSCRGYCCILNCTSDESKSPNLSFHKVPKRDSERITRINLFGNEEFVDKRSEWLRKLNIVDNGRKFLVRSLLFRSEDYNFLGKFSYSQIFHFNYSIIKLCITGVPTCCKITKQQPHIYNCDLNRLYKYGAFAWCQQSFSFSRYLKNFWYLKFLL